MGWKMELFIRQLIVILIGLAGIYIAHKIILYLIKEVERK
jgi:hypothetical protein